MRYKNVFEDDCKQKFHNFHIIFPDFVTQYLPKSTWAKEHSLRDTHGNIFINTKFLDKLKHVYFN